LSWHPILAISNVEEGCQVLQVLAVLLDLKENRVQLGREGHQVSMVSWGLQDNPVLMARWALQDHLG
jgi:hypothetical protein